MCATETRLSGTDSLNTTWQKPGGTEQLECVQSTQSRTQCHYERWEVYIVNKRSRLSIWIQSFSLSQSVAVRWLCSSWQRRTSRTWRWTGTNPNSS